MYQNCNSLGIRISPPLIHHKCTTHREDPVEDAVLLDGEEAVDGPGEVVLVLEVAQRVRHDLGSVRPPGHVDEAPLPPQAEESGQITVKFFRFEIRFCQIMKSPDFIIIWAFKNTYNTKQFMDDSWSQQTWHSIAYLASTTYYLPLSKTSTVH